MTNEEKMIQLNQIEKAYNQGILKVKYADKEVTYRSLPEMSQIISQLRKELGMKKRKLLLKTHFSRGS